MQVRKQEVLNGKMARKQPTSRQTVKWLCTRIRGQSGKAVAGQPKRLRSSGQCYCRQQSDQSKFLRTLAERTHSPRTSALARQNFTAIRKHFIAMHTYTNAHTHTNSLRCFPCKQMFVCCIVLLALLRSRMHITHTPPWLFVLSVACSVARQPGSLPLSWGRMEIYLAV